MKLKIILTSLVLTVLVPAIHAQTNAFTYQGRLAVSNNAVTGVYDLRFGLCTDAASSSAWVQTTNAAVGVTNGLFTTMVNLGYVPTDTTPAWLELAVRTNGSGDFTPVSPRQLITPAYSAFFAYSASNALTASSAKSMAATNLTGTVALTQLPATVVTNNATGVTLGGTFSGAFTGNGAGVTNVNAATLGGYAAANFWQSSSLISL